VEHVARAASIRKERKTYLGSERRLPSFQVAIRRRKAKEPPMVGQFESTRKVVGEFLSSRGANSSFAGVAKLMGIAVAPFIQFPCGVDSRNNIVILPDCAVACGDARHLLIAQFR
jgi:hypothetical protein